MMIQMSEGSSIQHWREWYHEVKPASRSKSRVHLQRADLELPRPLTAPSPVTSRGPVASSLVTRMSIGTYLEAIAFQRGYNRKPLE